MVNKGSQRSIMRDLLHLAQKGRQCFVVDPLLFWQGGEDLPYGPYHALPNPSLVTGFWRVEKPLDVVLPKSITHMLLIQALECLSQLSFRSGKVGSIIAVN